jgi:diacylglycerol kinase (ATP)
LPGAYDTVIILDNKFSSIGPIYYEYGSMVITFDSSNMAVNAYEILKNQVYEDKKLLCTHFHLLHHLLIYFHSLFPPSCPNCTCAVIMLPTVEPSMIPRSVLPLLIFVNVKSGGCQVCKGDGEENSILINCRD